MRAVWILVAVAVVLAGAGYWFANRLDGMAGSAIERYGSAALGTAVRVGRVNVSLRDARAVVSRIRVANPEQFSEPHALTVEQLVVELDPASIASSVLRIEEVGIAGLRLNAEQAGAELNLRTLQRNLDKGGGGGDSRESQRFAIDRFTVAGGEISIRSNQLKSPQELRLPDVNVAAIGAPNGVTAGEVAEQVLQPVLDAAVDALRESVTDLAKERLKEEVRGKIGERLRELGN